MKKAIILAFALLLGVATMAQPVTLIGTNEYTNTGDTVIVPVIVMNLPDVSAVSIRIRFNSDKFNFIGGNSQYEGFMFGTAANDINIAFMGGTLTATDGALCYIKLKSKGGDTPLTFAPEQGYCEYAGVNLMPIQGAIWMSGNIVQTITIGSQTWMKNNATFGNVLTPTVKPTDNNIIEGYSENNPRGYYYSWDEAMQYSTTPGAKGVCPTGWHVPTINEWETLVSNFVKPGEKYTFPVNGVPGWNNTAAPMMKAVYADKWTYWYPKKAAAQPSGFNAMPAGYWWFTSKTAVAIGFTAMFWTSEEKQFIEIDPKYKGKAGKDPIVFQMLSTHDAVVPISVTKATGFVSLRCIKD